MCVSQVAALSHSKARSSSNSSSSGGGGGSRAHRDSNRQRSESDFTSEASELEKFRCSLHFLSFFTSVI